MAGELISVRIEGLEQLRKMLEFTDPKLLAKAQKGGIAYAAKAVPTAAAKSIAARYNLKSARIKQDVRGPFITADGATLLFSRRAPTITQFGFKPGSRGGTQPGLGRGMGWGKPNPAGRPGSAALLKGQRQNYPTVFMAPGRNGIQLPFRQGKGRTASGRRRLVVEYGPSVGSIFDGQSAHGRLIRFEIESRINEQFIAGFPRVLDSAARGYGGR